VCTINNIYEESHQPEALEVWEKVCANFLYTIAAIHLLDYALLQAAKLSKTLQSETLEITAVSGLVDAVLHSLDDAVLPAANCIGY